MGKQAVELAKLALFKVSIEGVLVERALVTISFGFGVSVKATEVGFVAWLEAVTKLGITPTLNRFRRASQEASQPIEYIYEVFVDVPDNWQAPQ